MEDRVEIDNATGISMRLNIAGPGARSYAFVIDWHIRILLVLAYFAVGSILVVGGLSFPDGDTEAFPLYIFVVLVPIFVLYFFYHPVLEILLRGRTPGKRMAGVRIVTLNGESPSVLAHLIRNVLRLIDSMPFAYVIGLTTAILTKNSIRIGDIAAGTILIYESDARGDTFKAAPVSPLAIKAFGLQKAELAQDLLDRWKSLTETDRVRLAQRLIPELDASTEPAEDAQGLRAQLESLLAVTEVGT